MKPKPHQKRTSDQGIKKLLNVIAWSLNHGILLTIMFLLVAENTFANPQGGELAAGVATITTPTNNSTVVNQSSQQAIINWQSFNVGQQESVHFQQPDGGVVLNRVNGAQGPSSIDGRLTATGQVILVNPAGIYFGSTAQVNVGGLIASTANISDQDFLNGNYHFNSVATGSASVINNGKIIAANHGLVALIGGNVQNNGLIQANLGHVVLASGSSFTMSFAGNELVSFSVDEKSLNEGGVKNTGTIVANGGTILVSAKAAQGVLDDVINMKGVAQAQSVAEKNGEIIISGGETGNVRIAAKLDASGKQAGAKGGRVKVTGQKLIVEAETTIDVSGHQGGGDILIGGSLRGESTLPRAKTLTVAPNVQMHADALVNGKGGQVVIWSDQATNFYGKISSRGGTQYGDGGFVEVSGGHLTFQGYVDTSAAQGNYGTLLLDPKNINIITSGTIPSAQIVFNDDVGFTDNIDPATLIASDSNILLQANNNITFTNALSLTKPGISLTAQAGKSIIVNANISTNNGAISLKANDSNAVAADRLTGNGDITVAKNVTLNAGNQLITLQIGNETLAPFAPGTITLNDNSRLLTSGTIKLISNSMTFNTSSSQIGGTNVNSGLAANVILTGTTPGTTIGLGSGSGTLQLSKGELDRIRAANVRIGDAEAGNIKFGGTLATSSTFAANGVLTLATAGDITQSAGLDLKTNSNAELLLRAQNITLNNANNKFTTVAVNSNGSVNLKNSPSYALTIGSLSDDLGTVSGITAPNGVTLNTSSIGGDININENINTSGNQGNIALSVTSGNIIQAADKMVNAGTGTIIYKATEDNGTIITKPGSLILTTGNVILSANNMALDENANSQIGGSALGINSANNVILTVGSGNGTISMGIAGGAGSLMLSQAALDTIHANAVRFGGNAAIGTEGTLDPSSLSIGTWTPAATFATNGTITFHVNGNITQTGAINFSENGANLLIRNLDQVILTNPQNTFNQIAADTQNKGSLEITNEENQSLIIGSLTDDIGTINGINIKKGNFTPDIGVTLQTSGTGSILINKSITTTTGLDINLISGNGGITVANGVTINAGTSPININGGSGAIDFGSSILKTTNTSSSAIKITNASTVALGNISATGNGATIALGNDDITQAISQNLNTTILAKKLTANTKSHIYLTNAGNTISTINSITRGGEFILNNTGALTVAGPITTGNINSNVFLTTTGLLTIAGNIASLGTTNRISLSGLGYTQNANTTINAGSGDIKINAGTGTARLNAASYILSTGKIELIADKISFNTGATPSQLGGTDAGTGSAAFVILQPATPMRTIGIAGGTGGLSLSQAALNDIRATNVRIGNSSSGDITINTWTPATTFASNGVLTLDTSGNITQNGSINLSINGANLLLRNANNVILTADNILNQFAADIIGSLIVKNTGLKSLIVASLTDDKGTINGVNAAHSVVINSFNIGAIVNNPIISTIVNPLMNANNGLINAATHANNANEHSAIFKMTTLNSVMNINFGMNNFNNMQTTNLSSAANQITINNMNYSKNVNNPIEKFSGNETKMANAVDSMNLTESFIINGSVSNKDGGNAISDTLSTQKIDTINQDELTLISNQKSNNTNSLLNQKESELSVQPFIALENGKINLHDMLNVNPKAFSLNPVSLLKSETIQNYKLPSTNLLSFGNGKVLLNSLLNS